MNVPIVAVHCEGFKSRIWATGFDISDHAIMQEIVKPPREGVKTNKINFKNFFESARPEIIEMFKNFDLDPVFLYCNSTIEELSHLSESLATTCICGTLGNYLGNALEEKYGVPWLPSDFKKKEGYKRSIELSREYDLYRQNFCGCVYSRNQKTEENS